MYVISQAFLYRAEIVQTDRWKYGPLELVFADNVWEGCKGVDTIRLKLGVTEWNLTSRGGFYRSREAADVIRKAIIPNIQERDNPNIIIVPRIAGYTELHMMLSSLVPANILNRYGISKPERGGNFWLQPFLPEIFSDESDARRYALATEEAFSRYIWTKLVKSRRHKYGFFSKDSPLRVLAGDVTFWMSRIYRAAIERSETFDEIQSEETQQAVEQCRAQLKEALSNLSKGQYDKIRVRAPLKGGYLWDPNDFEQCESIIDKAIRGTAVVGSIEPILEILNSDRTHEDFSERYSWVKEDFERSFYSKRARVKVSLVETVDNFPAWTANEPCGYDNILFRDILSFFNRKDRHVILALRQGKTISEIAAEHNHKSHTAISRKVKVIKNKIHRLLH